MVARRREAFKETLRETIGQDGLEPFVIMAEELGGEFSPTDLAAAAFKLLLGPIEAPDSDPLAEAEPLPAREPPVGERPGAQPRRAPGFGPARGMTTLYLDVGRDDGVRPSDIVGAIANEADIPGRAIDAIELFDHFAFVEVPSARSRQVLHALQATTIGGRQVTPSLARPRR